MLPPDTARSSRPDPSPPKSSWWIPAGLVLLGLVPAIAGTARIAEVAGGAALTQNNARFLAAPIPALLHIGPAIVFSLVGAFQFSAAFRRRYPRWHRAAGRVLVPAGLLVALSGLWMAVTYPWPPGDGVGVFVERLVFGSAMLASMVLGVRALLRRRFKEHGRWMIRAYAIGMGAGTQVLTHLPWFLFVDMQPGETPRAVMMGLAWVMNVLVAEWIILHADGGGGRMTAFIPGRVSLRGAPASR